MPDLAGRNFVLQQGLSPPEGPSCSRLSRALLFQPRVVAVVLVVATILQSPALFFGLAGILGWCALFPALNPFDWVYNGMLGRRGTTLGPAPPPRRFAQGMAGAFALAIAVALWLEIHPVAWVLQGIFLLAVLSLVFGRFCLGSFVYHLTRGRGKFARDTLPWGPGA